MLLQAYSNCWFVKTPRPWNGCGGFGRAMVLLAMVDEESGYLVQKMSKSDMVGVRMSIGDVGLL